MKKSFLLFVILGVISVNGCTSIEEISGSMPLNTEVERLEIGRDNKETVLKLIGEPVNKETAHLNSWIYAQQKTQTFAFFRPKVQDRNILDLTFDKDDILIKIDKYNIKDGLSFNLNTKKVVTEGRKLTFWQQISGNVGNLSGEQFIN